MDLYTKNLNVLYGDNIIIKDLNINIPTGKITALVGANGSGKSTILKTMARIINPQKGEIFLDGKSIHNQPSKEIAKLLSILPQNPTAPEGLTVSELISYGRSPYKKGFGNLNSHDYKVINWALDITGISKFSNIKLENLSGGQRQCAWIAMALCQETKFLFLDEPTTFLDMCHQLEILKLLKKLNKEEKTTIIMVVHDLNHASRYADHIVAIKKGAVISEGSPNKVINKEVFKEVFGVEVDIVEDPRNGVPLCLPYDISYPNIKNNLPKIKLLFA